jgi:hypothetical protein
MLEHPRSLRSRSPVRVAGQAAGWKRIRAWSARARHHDHVGVGQDPGGLVSLEVHRAQRGGERIAAVPQPPGRVESEAAPVLLGVDHEHPTGADHQVVDVRPAAGDGQVVQDRPSVSLQRVEQPGGASLSRRPAPPRDRIWAGPEPQPPAGRRRGQPAEDQSQPGRQLAAKDSPTDTDPEEDGDPPGQGAGPDGPLGRPQSLPGRLGGTARPAHAGPDPHRHHRPISTGADQQLIGVVAQVGEDGLEVGLAERPHRPTRPIVIVPQGPRSRTGYRGAPFWGASRRPAQGLAGHAARQIAAW